LAAATAACKRAPHPAAERARGGQRALRPARERVARGDLRGGKRGSDTAYYCTAAPPRDRTACCAHGESGREAHQQHGAMREREEDTTWVLLSQFFLRLVPCVDSVSA